MEPPKFVIASTGHSGSGYISKVLREYGINCGHEEYFTYPWKEHRKRKPILGDSTWHIVNHLWDYHGIIFHQWRNPINVVNSLYHTFKESESKRFQYRYRLSPNRAKNRLDRTVAMVVVMNSVIHKHAKHSWNVEEFHPADIMEICATLDIKFDSVYAEDAIRNVPTDVNSHHEHDSYFGYNDLPETMWKTKLLEHAKIRGYL